MDETAPAPPPLPARPVHRWRWWIIPALLAATLLSLTAWLLGTRRVWTDGSTFWLSARDAKIRTIVWSPPRAVEGISSDEQVYEPSLSPDGTELYFVRGKGGGEAHLYVSKRTRGGWGAATAVEAVNGPFDSLGPRVTPDGAFLLFYSNRPGGFGGYDLWASPLLGDRWGPPFNLGPEVNSEFNEFNPDPTPDGRLIFTTNRKAAGQEQHEAWQTTIRTTVSADYDLWIAQLTAAPKGEASSVAPTTRPAATHPSADRLVCSGAHEIPRINTASVEGASCMSPAGDFLYFASNRPGGAGKFDLYRSRLIDGNFSTPEAVGPPVNTADNEVDPALGMNGSRLYFSSDRSGADGRYHLLYSDAREVYQQRLMLPMPHLGWSWWVLLASLALVIPLLMSLRGWDERRLSTLQRAILLSLLVHALLALLLSFVMVSQQVKQYVAKELREEFAINLRGGSAIEETIAMRSQVSSDLPLSTDAAAGHSPLARAADVAPPIEVSADLALPGAPATPGKFNLAIAPPAPPQVQAPRESSRAVPSAAIADALNPTLPSAPPVTGTEATPAASKANAVSTPRPISVSEATAAAPVEIGMASPPAAPVPTATSISIGVEHTSGISRTAVSPPVAAVPGVAELSPLSIGGTQGGGAAMRARSAEPSPVVAGASGANNRPTAIAAARGTPGSPPVETEIGKLPAAGVFGDSMLAESGLAPVLNRGAIRSKSQTTLPQVSVASSALATDDLSIGRTHAPSTQPSEPVPLTRGGGDKSVPASGPARPASGDPTGLSLATAEPFSGKVEPVGAGTAGSSSIAMDAALPARRPAASLAGGKATGPVASAASALDELPELSAAAMGSVKMGRGKVDAAPSVAGDGRASGDSQRSARPGSMADAGSPKLIEAPIARAAGGDKALYASAGIESPAEARIGRGSASSPRIAPDISLSPLSGPLGPGKLLAPDSPFMRAPEQRKPLLKKLGGTRESEDAVGRGLAYLARMQEPDGRWTRVDDDEPPGKRTPRAHDTAVTGLAVLAFLAQNHTPAVEGPYRQTVSRAIDALIALQEENGDLRGPANFRGGGADQSNLYDQGIATYALAECAIMTHDPRTVEAALKGARFIVASQNSESGGWRYAPNEAGDSSIFGWQIMALHSAEQVGFQIPADTLANARRYLAASSEGESHMLGGYQPHTGATPPMTAELLFARMLLGIPLSDAGMAEATEYLRRTPPDAGNADIYYWYYASLSMLQMHNAAWKEWNAKTRDALIHMQQKDGKSAGCWKDGFRWGDRGGRIFTTAMATLTLEVYYRYLPLRPDDREQPRTRQQR